MSTGKFTRFSTGISAQLAHSLTSGSPRKETEMRTADLEISDSEFDPTPSQRKYPSQAEPAGEAWQEEKAAASEQEPGTQEDSFSEVSPEEEVPIELPPALVLPTALNMPFVMELYSQKCLSCNALGTGETIYTRCHFDNGNQLCPAKDLTVKFVGRVRAAAAKLHKATQSGDQEAVARCLRKITEDPDDSFLSDVMTEFKRYT